MPSHDKDHILTPPSHRSHCPDPDRHPLQLDRDLYRGEPVLADDTAAGNPWTSSPDLVSLLGWLSHDVSVPYLQMGLGLTFILGRQERGSDDCSLMVGNDWNYYCLLSKTTINPTLNHIVQHSCHPGDSRTHNFFLLYPWLTSANPTVTAQGWCLVASPLGLISTACSRTYPLIRDLATVPASSAEFGG